MAKREKISAEIQTELLVRCARRCCVCYGLGGDTSLKKGQIAHLNKDPNSNSLENLVYLCFDHHDEYDSITRQSKGLTKTELIEYRKRLYTYLESISPQQVSKDIVLPSLQDQELIVHTIDRYFTVGYMSPDVIAAEIRLRISKLREYRRLMTKARSRKKGNEDIDNDLSWDSNHAKRALELPDGIWDIESELPRNLGSYTDHWAQGTLTYQECGRLFMLLDEDIDCDEYYILFGLPCDTVSALGKTALYSFLYHFGIRNSEE